MSVEVNGLKAAFWCRLIFDVWGVSSPEEMFNYKSARSAFTENKYRIDEIFDLYKGSKKQDRAYDILYENNNNVKKWSGYFLGKSSPSLKFVNEVDELVAGSEFFFKYGAKSLFNVMSAKSPEEALNNFKEELIECFEKPDDTHFIHKNVIGEIIYENEPPSYEYDLVAMTEEDIESLQSNNWLAEYRKLRAFLPNIDAFHNGFPKSEVNNLYIHIAYEVISAKFLTEEYKYHNLAKVLFVKHGINAIENFEHEMGIPNSLWLDITFIKDAFDWYSTYLTEA
ncbi:hypothetical protein [Colwellia sp. 20A7]|uniref:hypothetical protein n=1 Tax=Colwellia sp. 20A7 TaxID=2689569 RepID=UPI00135AF2ED|nr:hypothetical protein [Colwellia sp. 20A7]